LAEIISVTVPTGAISQHISRKAKSVTPAIGASQTSGNSILKVKRPHELKFKINVV
jgi:hypothetical protein